MKAKRPSWSDPPGSKRRVLVGVLVVGAVFFWLARVRAGAESSDLELAALAPGQESGQALLWMDEIVSLDLRSTEAADAIKYLATKGGLNIAISKNVAGRVNLLLTDVPIRDVF